MNCIFKYHNGIMEVENWRKILNMSSRELVQHKEFFLGEINRTQFSNYKQNKNTRSVNPILMK